jgi:hypothetical protein
VTLSNRLDVSGGEGGEILVLAGEGFGGNLNLDPDGRALADATGTNGPGGIVTLSANGDGQSTGNIFLDGSVSATGSTSVAVGGDGGEINIEAVGSIVGLDSRGSRCRAAPQRLLTSADCRRRPTCGRPLGAGRGNAGVGGDIAIEAVSTLSVGGTISVTGPDSGGLIELSIETGQIDVYSSAVLDASGSLGGDGGDIVLDASFSESSALIQGTILSDGGSTPTTGPAEAERGCSPTVSFI